MHVFQRKTHLTIKILNLKQQLVYELWGGSTNHTHQLGIKRSKVLIYLYENVTQYY